MNAFYSMIPPVLVFLSLTGIIVFLFKKSRKVARFSFSEEKKDGIASSSFEKIRSFGKIFGEKTVEGSKIAALKIGKTLLDWGKSLAEKGRKKRMDSDLSGARQSLSEDFLKKNLPAKEDKEEEPEREPEVYQRQDRSESFFDKSALSKIKEKNQLEDALIERIASNPKDTEAYERLGQYYFEIGNYDHAKECYKQVMKLSPGNIGVRSRMRKLERMLGG